MLPPGHAISCAVFPAPPQAGTGGVENLSLRTGCRRCDGCLSTGNELAVSSRTCAALPRVVARISGGKFSGHRQFRIGGRLVAHFVLSRRGRQRHPTAQAGVLEGFWSGAVSCGLGKVSG